MAYVKTNWVSDVTPVSPTNMNHIEDGIEAAHVDLAAHQADVVTDSNGAHGLKIEEGLWTPVLYGETTAGTNTYNASREGQYYKIGKQVYIQARISLSAKDVAMAGNIRISGMPFAPVNGYSAGCLAVGLYQGIDFAAGFTQISVRIQTNSTITLHKNGDNVLPQYIDASEILSNLVLDFSGTYKTA